MDSYSALAVTSRLIILLKAYRPSPQRSKLDIFQPYLFNHLYSHRSICLMKRNSVFQLQYYFDVFVILLHKG